MYIKEIELKDFRNYDDIRISFSDKVNIFLGNNAQGKTNLLEGIYLNAMAKSFKTTHDKELIQFGKEFCRIKTIADIDNEEHVTEILINSQGKKAINLNGVRIQRTSEILERIFIIIFSPEDLKIVKDEPEKRRRFIDRELCLIKPGYYNDLNNYRRVLKQRNTYLKEESIDTSVLDIWDHELVRYGSKLILRRIDFIKRVNDISHEIHHKISGGREQLEVKYEPNVTDVTFHENSIGSIEAINSVFYDAIKEKQNDDIKNRTTSIGPHKDDLKISADGIDLRKFGSQGQQRTAALSLKLSEIKLIEEDMGEKPILLLDDVLSELDNDRQTYLINSLGGNQLFITTTDISGKVARSLPESKVFKIVKGQVDIEI